MKDIPANPEIVRLLRSGRTIAETFAPDGAGASPDELADAVDHVAEIVAGLGDQASSPLPPLLAAALRGVAGELRPRPPAKR